jgi:hypothetical protein
MTIRSLLIVAQALTLVALGAGLAFVTNTSGGTVFLFTTIAPLCGGVASLIVIGAAIAVYRRRQSLFSSVALQPGQILFRQGDVGDCAYFIRSGVVEVLRDNAGEETLVARLGPGQYFGEMALLSSEPRNATIRAAEACSLAVLGKRNFMTLLKALPSMREQFLTTAGERKTATERGQNSG